MTFKYDYTVADSFTFPLVNVIVRNKNNNKFTGYIALVDSGAVFCVFHSDIAKTLGIDLALLKEKAIFKGVGKAKRTLTGKVAVIEIMVSQKGERYNFDSAVVFSDDVAPDAHPLLGMAGFFNKFSSITFDNQRQKLILEK